MSEKVLKAGIIGCGGIANSKHLPALKKNKNVNVVAFCDIVESKAQAAALKYGAEEARIYTDYKELLKDTAIDVVYVCTPNREHSKITVDSLYAGKHVMCEKPMARNTSEAKLMLDAAKETGKKLTIGYQNRFRKEMQYLNGLCDQGVLGDIYYGKAIAIRRRGIPTWGVFTDLELQGGGPLIDIATHALDLTLWMMNNYKPKMVVGKTFAKLTKQRNTGNAWGDWDPNINVEDSAFGFVIMENGALICVDSSWAMNRLDVGEAKNMLCGTLAGADFDANDQLRINYIRNGVKSTEIPQFAADGVAFNPGSNSNDAADKECAAFIKAILNDTDVPTKPEQAFVVTQILDAIYESDKTGKPIIFE